MIKLIVGLGNPGAEYAKTRHNAGAWLVAALADQHQVDFKLEKKFHGSSAVVTIADQSCRLFIPATYMNLSGQAVAAIANFYQIAPEEILVAHDELDLPVGVARLKFAGGHGGHNGLRDIFEKISNQNFYRIRVGIGKPENKNIDTVDYVLHAPGKAERALINDSIDKAIAVLPTLLKGDVSGAMKELNTEPKKPSEPE